MAIKKISEFDDTTQLSFQDLVITSWFDGVDVVSRKARLETVLNAGTKTFRGFISQVGTNAPVLTDIYNNYEDLSFTTAYVGVGEYSLDGFSGALGTSTHVRINTNALDYGQHIKTEVTGGDQLKIYTYDNTGANADSIMNIDGLVIEIITYI